MSPTLRSQTNGSSPIDAALRQFEAAEANLTKLERIYAQARAMTPNGIAFGSDTAYDQLYREYRDLLEALPTIDGWKPDAVIVDLDELAQARFDAQEVDELSSYVATESMIDIPARQLAEYRHRLNKKRRALIGPSVMTVLSTIDGVAQASATGALTTPHLDVLATAFRQLDVLLGGGLARPRGWTDTIDATNGRNPEAAKTALVSWLKLKTTILATVQGANDPIPTSGDDLGTLANAHPQGPVAIGLDWERLSAGDFERLLFALISDAKGYENPEWLMHTTAPDRGRDLSVMRVVNDALGGTTRQRIIIQCRHRAQSVTPTDVATLREQVTSWEPPRVDVLVIATSGRFTADAVHTIERSNIGDRALRIEMWPESHLERLLATRPGLIAEFGLR